MKDANNVCVFVGNLGKAPEGVYTPNGVFVVKFPLAISNRVKQDDDTYVDEPDWANIIVFGKLAERVAAILGKGSTISAVCRYQNRKYETQSGETRYAVEFLMDSFHPVANFGRNRRDAGDAEEEQQYTSSPEPFDIPF